MLRRALSAVVISAIALAGVAAIEGRVLAPVGMGSLDEVVAADHPGLIQAGRGETRLARPVDARTGHSLPTSFLVALPPVAGFTFAPSVRDFTSSFARRDVRPGRCVASGRSSRGPPVHDSSSSES